MSSRLFLVLLSGLLVCLCTQPLGAQGANHYLPSLDAADGKGVGLGFVNPDAVEAQVILIARRYDGRPIGTSVVSVPAFGKIELGLAGVFGDGTSLQPGWLELSPSTSAVKLHAFVFDDARRFVERMDVTSTTASRLIFPKVSAQSKTILNVVNTAAVAVDATISLYDDRGALAAFAPISLAAGSGIARTTAELVPGNTTFEGYAVVETSPSGALVGSETYRTESDVAAVQAIPAQSGLMSGYWPHFISGWGYTSRLILINAGDTAQTLRISARSAAGAADVVRTLSPHERLNEAIADLFAYSGQSVLSGEIHFTAQTNAPGIFSALEYATTDGMSISVLEAQAAPKSDFYFTHIGEGAEYYTGLAFFNPIAGPSTALLDLFDKSGVLQASTTLELAPGEHKTALVDPLFATPNRATGGYIRVSAAQPIFAQEIVGSTGAASFMAAVPAEAAAASTLSASATVAETPSITSLSPWSALTKGLTSLNVRISGTGFTRDSAVKYDGVKMTTRFLSSTLLAITLSGARLNAGVHSIQVVNPIASSNVVKLLLAYSEYPQNRVPVVNAGPDQNITLPALATLSGSVTDDGLPVQTTLSVTWSLVSGPAAVIFSNPNATNTSATFSTDGTYTLRLTANDGALSSSDDIVLTVAAAPAPPPPPPTGAVYYVSNSGSDSNSGTGQSSAWKTIAKVQSFLPNLKPGDSVLFQRGGIWYEQLNVNNVNGASGSPITFGNYGAGNLPIIDGGGTKSGYLILGGRQWCIGGSGSKMSYLTIDGFECRHTSTYGIAFIGVSAGSAGITVQNSYIHDTGSGDTGYYNQLMFAEYNYGAAYGTKFLNNKVGNCYGHNCIQIHGDRGGPLIQGNECYGFSHNCIDLKYVQGAVVDSNVAHDGLGIQQYENAFYLQNETAAYTGDVTWTRNVVYGSNVSTAFQCQEAGGPVSCRVYNNTVYGTMSGVFGGGNVSNVRIYVKNNIFDTPAAQRGGGYAEWDYNDTVQSTPIGVNDIRMNPQYVNAAVRDFRLQSSSPVIDKGINVNLVYKGIAPDLGAFEF